jgi:hypothetical protein
MCDLCDEQTKAMVRQAHTSFADDFRKFAQLENSIGVGRIRPHTKEMEQVAEKAKWLIRILAENYL